MTTDLPRLSAHALGILESGCPREFALRYKAGRYWPATDGPAARAAALLAPTETDDAALGTAFHLLAHQQALGLDVAPLVAALAAELPKLPAIWAGFLASDHARLAPGTTVWTEQALHFEVAGVPVMVRFDRVVRDGDRWTIFDWKTGRPQAKKLQEGWQARLYPYALVAAAQALPGGAPVRAADVRLVFWEVERGTPIEIRYDDDRHAEVHAALVTAAGQAAATFDPAVEDDPAFPKKVRRCPRCAYHDFCNRRFEGLAPAVPPPRPSFLVARVPRAEAVVPSAEPLDGAPAGRPS